MKNFKLNKPSLTRYTTNLVSCLVVLSLITQVYYPVLAFAEGNDSSATDSSESTAVVDTGDAVSGTTVETETNTTKIDTATEEETTDTEEVVENEEEEEEVVEEDKTTEEGEDTSNSNASSTEQTENKSSESNITASSTENTIATSTENEDTDSISDTSASSSPNIASTTPNQNQTSTSTASSTEPTSIEISGTNTATSSTTASSSANTGNNTTESANFTTNTGDAVSYVDVTNVINTNIVNSTGLIDFIREVLGYEDFDLRDSFYDIFRSFQTAESSPICADSLCDQAKLFIDLVNQANLENDISIEANTGNNSSTGNGEINTGNAYASANLTNIVNTNIIDSNYLLLTFSNFSNMAGSLVLPNSDFFDKLFKNTTGSNNSSVNLTNNATTSNNVVVQSDTGNNSTEGDDSTIETGNAIASSYTDNFINQNFLNTDSFSMLVRVHGNWSGDIFGLPEGMQWENTANGIRLFYTGTNSGNSGTSGNISNTANINNNVKVFALTGDNEISNSNKAKITTGNAYADSTILNIANTNVIGSNWINLIFNIYGNWDGNIAFGQPNLWVGLEAKTGNRSYLEAQSEINYKYTVFNRGDTIAKNVILDNTHPTNALNFINSPTDKDDADGRTVWNIGDIKPGETKEINVKTKTVDTYGEDRRLPLPMTTTVYSDQPDADDSDNTDSVLLYIGEGNNSDRKSQPNKTFPAKFIIEKTADKSFAKAGDTVNYTISIESLGGQLFESVLVDTLRDENGNTLNEQSWSLETIKNGEEITITYSIIVPEGINGVLTNSARLLGAHLAKQSQYQDYFESQIVEHKLAVGEITETELLGADSLVTVCEPYLKTYLRQNTTNDTDEVVRLQQFLFHYVSGEVSVSGVFDNNTRKAVEKFQQQYKADILTPWGISRSSGYVYYTTQKKINEIMCGEKIDFPLTENQEQEINYFRLNNTQTDADSLLFGGEPAIPENLAEAQTPETIVATAPHNYHNLTEIYFPNFDDQIAYNRYENWLVLFGNQHTAYLDN